MSIASSLLLPPTGEDPAFNSNYIFYWNNVACDLNRITVSLGGPLSGPPGSARGFGIVHLAMHDAYFAIKGGPTPYLATNNPTLLPPLNGAIDAAQAVAGAAYTVLHGLFGTPSLAVADSTTDQCQRFLVKAAQNFIVPNSNPPTGLDFLSPSYHFGDAVGKAMLALLDIPAGSPGFNQGEFTPQKGPFKFDDDPSNPVKTQLVDPNNPTGPIDIVHIYHAPYYGLTAKKIAVQHDHLIADPPMGTADYYLAFDEVIAEGGADGQNTTKRTPKQTEIGHTWAYDGANLIGTPPRLYNQILRTIAWNQHHPADKTTEAANAEFARLFALANAAMADAGIFAWREKYTYQLWRPLSGVREDGTDKGNAFWDTLGAPATNTFGLSFKPPFPAYPSGHATFGGAFFQVLRRFYKQRDNLPFPITGNDNIGFTFVSDELNGISRDLYQPYDPTQPIQNQSGFVRPRLPHTYTSLWQAMFENAISRVFLGVHWGFDAFARKDVQAATPQPNAMGVYNYKAAADITYTGMGRRNGSTGMFPVGGVPLGIGIADDIFDSGLKIAPPAVQPVFTLLRTPDLFQQAPTEDGADVPSKLVEQRPPLGEKKDSVMADTEQKMTLENGL